MFKPKDNAGFVLLCDRKGVLQKLLYDELHIGKQLAFGKSFLQLIDVESVKTARKFIDALPTDKPVFDIALWFPFDGKRMFMQFAAYAYEDDFVIVGAKSKIDVIRICHKLLQWHFEDIEAKRHALTVNDRVAADREAELLTHVNELKREMIVLQAELHEKTEALRPAYSNVQLKAAGQQLDELRASVKQLKTELAAQTQLVYTLQCTQEDWQAAFHFTPTALCIVSLPDGKFVAANDHFRRLSGYTREQLRGLLLTNLLSLESLDGSANGDPHATPPSEFDAYVQMRAKDKPIRSVRACLQNLSFDGQPCMLVSVHELNMLQVLQLNPPSPAPADEPSSAAATEGNADNKSAPDADIASTTHAEIDEFLQRVSAQLEQSYAQLIAQAVTLRERASLLESETA